jgi:adhesin/invasin
MIRACAPVSRMNAALLRNHRFMCVLFMWSILVIGSREQLMARTAESSSEVKTTEGTEFWLCFQRNFKDFTDTNTKNPDDLSLELYIISNKNTKVRLDIKALGYYTEISIEAGKLENIQIDPYIQAKSIEKPEKSAIHIESDYPIVVYGLSSRFQTTDAFQGIPVSSLGTQYRTICFDYSKGLLSEFAIVATENNTKITIVPSVKTSSGKSANKPYTITLQQGEVYQVIPLKDSLSKCDLSGSLITSNYKIAVFSGHQCAYVPSGIVGCNYLVEQLPSIDTWGMKFLVGKFESRTHYTLRVLAHESNTKIHINSALKATLKAGQFYEFSYPAENLLVEADQPILVALYSQGFLSGDKVGDPMMLLVNPIDQYLDKYTFATPITGQWNNFINIFIPTKSISSIRIDYDSLNKITFQPLGNSEYSTATLKVRYGFHTISANAPFGMYSYGFGYGTQAYDAYGTMGGQSFNSLDTGSNSLKNK